MRSDTTKPRSWFEKISLALSGEPKNKQDLLEILRDAVSRELLDNEALKMIEGVLAVSNMQVRDIMIPRAQITFVQRGQSAQDFLPPIVETGHSRYPVFDEDKEHVVGILLTKDLLKYYFTNKAADFILTDALLRPAFFVPESKRLDVLLREFRSSRNHLAVVVDEYGAIAGLVSIEDVLEEIVGDIEDEYDIDEEIMIEKQAENCYLISALTPVEDFNQTFSSQFSDAEVDTIGGVIVQHLGYVPKVGDEIKLEHLIFTVQKADDRRILSLMVVRNETKP